MKLTRLKIVILNQIFLKMKKKNKYYANISKKEIVIKVINVYIVIQKIILLVNFTTYIKIVQKKIASKRILFI